VKADEFAGLSCKEAMDMVSRALYIVDEQTRLVEAAMEALNKATDDPLLRYEHTEVSADMRAFAIQCLIAYERKASLVAGLH
jgi:hypothetical protein